MALAAPPPEPILMNALPIGFSGDEIVSINGTVLQGLRHAQAISLFKAIKCGNVALQLSRRQKKAPL